MICDCDAHRGPQKSLAISKTLHCDVGVRWKVASDLRFRVAISEAEPLLSPGFLAIWLHQRGNRYRLQLCNFWCAKYKWFLDSPIKSSPSKTKCKGSGLTFLELQIVQCGFDRLRSAIQGASSKSQITSLECLRCDVSNFDSVCRLAIDH